MHVTRMYVILECLSLLLLLLLLLQGYVFLDTMDTREYDALQLSTPSSMLKVSSNGGVNSVMVYLFYQQC